VGPRAGLDALVKRNNPIIPRRELTPGRTACSLVPILTELSRLLTEKQTKQIYSDLTDRELSSNTTIQESKPLL